MPLAFAKSFCITFVLVAFFYQVESVPAYRSAAQENQPANSQSGSPAVEKPLTNEQATGRSSDTETTPNKIKKAEWVQIGINTFIALIVLWQAWTYHQQRKLMQRQLASMAISERAYVGVKDMKFVSPLAVGQCPIVRAIFINGGRTPAWDFVAYCRVVIHNKSITEAAIEFPLTPFRVRRGAFLPAGAEKRVEFPTTGYVIDDVRLAAVTEGLLKLYVIGEARYRDFLEEWQVFPIRVVYEPADGAFSEADEEENPK